MTAAKLGASSTTAKSELGATKKSAAAIVAAQKREAQRKLLVEMRRKNKLAIASNSANENENVIVDWAQFI